MRRAFAAVGRRLHRRPAVAAGLIYAAIIVVFLGPGLLPGRALSSSDWLWHEPPWVSAKPEALGSPSNPDLGDWSEYLHPFAEYSAAATPRVPLWNPHLQSGRPYEANAQSALFGPFTWPLYVLPFWTAVGWIAVLKLWVAALGTYLLGRALGMRFGGALVAGIAFALSLKMVTWLIYPTAAVWSLYPWVLLAVERLVRRPSLLSGAGLAVVVALQLLCGHPESSFHALLLAASFFVLRTWQAHP